MAFKKDHVKELDMLLNRYRISVSMKEVVLKKHASVFNNCLRELFNIYRKNGIDIPMLHIILSLDAQKYYDAKWLWDNIFDDEIKRIMRDEAIDLYGLSDEKSNIDILEMFDE